MPLVGTENTDSTGW